MLHFCQSGSNLFSENLQIDEIIVINYFHVIKSLENKVLGQAELTGFCLFYFAYSNRGRRKKIEEEFHRN